MPHGGRQPSLGTLEIQHAQLKIFEMVDALQAACGFSGRINRRQKQTHQDADDRDNDQ